MYRQQDRVKPIFHPVLLGVRAMLIVHIIIIVHVEMSYSMLASCKSVYLRDWQMICAGPLSHVSTPYPVYVHWSRLPSLPLQSTLSIQMVWLSGMGPNGAAVLGMRHTAQGNPNCLHGAIE